MRGHDIENNRKMLSLISDLARAARCCQKEGVFCERITFSQFRVLDAVGERGKMRLSELHDFLGVDKSTTTRLVNPLVRYGLIRREKSDRDGRAVHLSLTRDGIDTLNNVWECLSPFIGDIRRRIPEEKSLEVYESVKIFLNAMKKAGSIEDSRV
ncbi:MAG: MarR family transcriptional regulator [Deltaproteobacteria bacterium]|nr:MarR family transcriptional regulator [Deltaproteobacteria bacterium]